MPCNTNAVNQGEFGICHSQVLREGRLHPLGRGERQQLRRVLPLQGDLGVAQGHAQAPPGPAMPRTKKPQPDLPSACGTVQSQKTSMVPRGADGC